MKDHIKKLKLKVHGTHCASCEVLIERKWKKIPGVEKVLAHYATGRVEVFYSGDELKLNDLRSAIKSDGYSVSLWEERHNSGEALKHKNSFEDYVQIGATFLIILNAYLILRQLNFLPDVGVTENMGYGFVFIIGLVASMSTCLAVTGGLLLAVAGKYSEMYPNLTRYEKFKPTLYFNVGRIVSYTLLGGLIGALGSAISLSPRGTGILTVVASLVMIIMGFQMLNLFSWMRHFQPKMPKFIAHKIHDLSEGEGKAGAFTLGAGTFFLPCGFTQALQLYVLAKGSFTVGALTMLAFSLGTLPMLLSLGAVSSFAKGLVKKHFLRFSAVLVIILGVWNINNGLVLAGVDIDLSFFTPDISGTKVETAKIVDGRQIVEMRIDDYSYTPSRFIVKQGIPVEWRIDASNAAGCAQVITAPAVGVTKYLPPSKITTITFTPKEVGTIPFSCTMGMTTPGASFTVISDEAGGVSVVENEKREEEKAETKVSSVCNPEIANCIPSQKFDVEITQERGFYPNILTVKKGIPVEVTINDIVPLGGCMSVMVIPEYDVTLPLKIGKNILSFTPTGRGTVYAVCSMGVKMIQFNVVDHEENSSTE